MPAFTFCAINSGGGDYYGISSDHLTGIDILFMSEYPNFTYWENIDAPLLRANGFTFTRGPKELAYNTDKAVLTWRADKFEAESVESQSAYSKLFDGLEAKLRKGIVNVLGRPSDSSSPAAGTTVIGIHNIKTKENVRGLPGRDWLADYIIERTALLPSHAVDGGTLIGGDFNIKHSGVNSIARRHRYETVFVDDSVLTTTSSGIDNVVYNPATLRLSSDAEVHRTKAVAKRQPHYPITAAFQPLTSDTRTATVTLRGRSTSRPPVKSTVPADRRSPAVAPPPGAVSVTGPARAGPSSGGALRVATPPRGAAAAARAAAPTLGDRLRGAFAALTGSGAGAQATPANGPSEGPKAPPGVGSTGKGSTSGAAATPAASGTQASQGPAGKKAGATSAATGPAVQAAQRRGAEGAPKIAAASSDKAADPTSPMPTTSSSVGPSSGGGLAGGEVLGSSDSLVAGASPLAARRKGGEAAAQSPKPQASGSGGVSSPAGSPTSTCLGRVANGTGPSCKRRVAGRGYCHDHANQRAE